MQNKNLPALNPRERIGFVEFVNPVPAGCRKDLQ